MNRVAHLVVMFIAPVPLAAVDYARDIKPLLKERCVSCHGSVKQKGDLRLDAGALIDKGVHAELIEACDLARRRRAHAAGRRATHASSQTEALQQWIRRRRTVSE
jgi:hypothetical protein